MPSVLVVSGLSRYILSEKQLRDNGYPLQSELSFHNFRENGTNHGAVRTCSRCMRQYVVTDEDVTSDVECFYHLEKPTYITDKILIHLCCNKPVPSQGCKFANRHVNSTKVCDIPFVQTVPLPYYYCRTAYALDTEMCYTTKGLEVVKVSVVSLNKKVVVNTFVRPKNQIIDFNTRYSGVSAEDLEGVTVTLEQVQQLLLQFIHSNTVLIGHALNNDLHGLGIVHRRVVDTSVLFQDKRNSLKKISLKTLAAALLRKRIQDSPDGHDSVIDALTCVELLEYAAQLERSHQLNFYSCKKVMPLIKKI